MDSLRDATTARQLHNKVTELEPANIDARLVQGLTTMWSASLPWHIRMVGFLAGFSGDKERGIRTLEDVARRGKLNDVDAEVLLCAIYRRERSLKKAVPLLQDLIPRFPRNFLFRFELSQMYADLGDSASCPARAPGDGAPEGNPDRPATVACPSRRSNSREASSNSGTTTWTRRNPT